jgi:lysophospholipase L1-like esterase
LLPSLAVNELPATGAVSSKNIEKFDKAVGGFNKVNPGHGGVIWLYPTVDQLDEARHGREWLAERPEIEAIAKRHGFEIIDVATRLGWNASLYRDRVHPTAEGNKVLAEIISEDIRNLVH